MAKNKGASNKKKVIIISAVVIVLIGMIVVGVKGTKKGGITVQVQKVERLDVISIVSGSGKIQPKTQVNITSEVNAEIMSIPVSEGDNVTRDQVLIQLETLQATKDMESSLYAANELAARLEGARIQLAQLHDNHERQKELHATKMASEQMYKDAYYSYMSQKANIKALIEQKKAADSRLEKSQDNLNKTTIKAPMDGVITWVDMEVGEIAQAQTSFTQGKTLMILSDLSAFEVEVEIDETDIADLETDQTASVEIDAFPDMTFAGRVTEIGNTATTSGFGSSDQATNFKVMVILLDTHKGVRPGMSATVDITTNEHNDVVVVPIQAIVMRNPDDIKNKTVPKGENKTATSKDLEASDPVITEEADAEAGAEPAGEVDQGSSGEIADTVLPVEEATAVPTETGNKAKRDKSDKKEDVKGVFLVKDGNAYFSEVTSGISDQQNIEIIMGVQEDDEVIIGSFQTLRKLKHGDKVKAEKEDTTKEKSDE